MGAVEAHGLQALAVANLVLKLIAGFFTFFFQVWLGYNEAGTYTGIYRVVNFLDLAILNGITSVAQRLLTGVHEDMLPHNVGLGVDFVVVFVLFQVVWSNRNTFADRMTETEP